MITLGSKIFVSMVRQRNSINRISWWL